jgi:putative SOS response-associated peptidase YedK
MCGRYATSQTSADLTHAFEADLVSLDGELEADYNVAPTKSAPVVIGRRGDGAADTEPAERELMQARWGLVPSWAKDVSIGNRMINARAETLAEKPSFRRAFAKRRSLVPADGYYEWYTSDDAVRGAKARKQPFFIRPKDGAVMAMAGLHEFWKDPRTDAWLITFTIITTSAEDSLGHLHDRMPLFVEPDGWDAWLDPAPRPTEELLELLTPAAPGRLDAYPVSTAVNNVRNNGPELLEPLASAE